jgi:HD-like signal output (HDOD) protein
VFSFFVRKKTDPAKALREAFGTYTLPSFSKVDLEIMRRIREPYISTNDIAQVLELDPGLSVKLLRLANSAAYTPRHDVSSLSMAVALVGLSQLESLVMTATLKKGVPRCDHKNLGSAAFWGTSALRGVLARDLAKRICPARTTECFTAGFLQDLAVPFLISQHPGEYDPLVEAWHAGDSEFWEAERDLFDWDHAQVATWIAQEWELPESLASAIGGHHSPDDTAYDCPLPVALVANLSDTDESLERLCANLEKHLSKEDVVTLVESAQLSARELAQFMT